MGETVGTAMHSVHREEQRVCGFGEEGRSERGRRTDATETKEKCEDSKEHSSPGLPGRWEKEIGPSQIRKGRAFGEETRRERTKLESQLSPVPCLDKQA